MTSTTLLYFVRHAESLYVPGDERSRGLTERGQADALRVRRTLHDICFDAAVSSPYERAMQTIRPTAGDRPIRIYEDLRERTIGEFGDTTSFAEAKCAVYQDFDFSFPGGESSRSAQQRAASVILTLLRAHEGETVLIGTHGDIMTLIFNRFDAAVGYEFWRSLAMPDIYKLEFYGEQLARMNRIDLAPA